MSTKSSRMASPLYHRHRNLPLHQDWRVWALGTGLTAGGIGLGYLMGYKGGKSQGYEKCINTVGDKVDNLTNTYNANQQYNKQMNKPNPYSNNP